MEVKPFKIKIDKAAIVDIEDAAAWYSKISPSLVLRFKRQLKRQIDELTIKAYV